jgi:hypothetical protein
MQTRTFSQQVQLLGRDSLLQGRLLVLQSSPRVYVRLSLELLPEHADCTFFVHDLLPQLLQLFLLLLSLAFHSKVSLSEDPAPHFWTQRSAGFSYQFYMYLKYGCAGRGLIS